MSLSCFADISASATTSPVFEHTFVLLYVIIHKKNSIKVNLKLFKDSVFNIKCPNTMFQFFLRFSLLLFLLDLLFFP